MQTIFVKASRSHLGYLPVNQRVTRVLQTPRGFEPPSGCVNLLNVPPEGLQAATTEYRSGGENIKSL
jgi:hypothetical protein